MRLSEFSVGQPVLVNLLSCVVILAGLAAWSKMPKEMFPVIEFDMITIVTTYPGASPSEVESIITIPVENAVRIVDGIDSIQSTSLEGRSLVILMFLPGERDMDQVLNEVSTQVNRAKEDFPEDVDDPSVAVATQDLELITAVLSSGVDERALKKIAQNLEDQLYLIDGVSSVQTQGTRKAEVTINLDPDAMQDLGVSIEDVRAGIQSSSVNIPLGSIETDREEVLIRLLSEFDPEDADLIGNTIVKQDAGGKHVYLYEVAEVNASFEEAKLISRLNGSPAVTLEVRKRSDADSLTVIEEVRIVTKSFAQGLPQTMRLSLVKDRSVWIKRRLDNMLQSALIGLAIVLSLLFLFLDLRMALITAFGIPLSVLGAIWYLSTIDVSMNMIVMFGFIVVMGMIVDDAIVIVENCYRYIEKGMHPREAAIVGATEVAWPVVSAVLTTIAAFVPLMLIKGIMGKFILYIPVVVVVCLATSLTEALIVVPSHIAEFAKAKKKTEVKRIRGSFRKYFDKIYHDMLSLLTFVLKYSLRHRYVVLGVAVVSLTGLIFYSVFMLGFVFLKTQKNDVLILELETATGTPLIETSRIMARVESGIFDEVKRDEEFLSVASIIGERGQGGDKKRGTNLARINIELVPEDDRERSTAEIENSIRNVLANEGELSYIEMRGEQGGPPTGAPISVRIRGDDLSVLRLIASDVKNWLSRQRGVVDIRDDGEGLSKELKITLDRPRAAMYHVSDRDIANTIRTAFAGQTASEIQTQDEEVRVVLRYEEGRRAEYSDLLSVEIPTSTGTVPLHTIAGVVQDYGTFQIKRNDQKRTITVTADVDAATDVQAVGVLSDFQTSFGEPGPLRGYQSGYSYDLEGEDKYTQEMIESLSIQFPLAIFVIYLILAAQFRSYVKPMIVMTAIPFGLLGVVIGLAISGEPLQFLSLIGFVALCGIVVNDSLVLVDFINRAREEGESRFGSIIRSVRIRLRPIMLTSLTTIGGLLPMALGTSADSAMLAPMAISIIWGLSFATILTLIFIPTLYAIMDDIIAFLANYRKDVKIAFLGEKALRDDDN
ncbi:MAG: efflux RND transporter permease subunit [Planctomycetes bacterium]|nr:efflux RND transporter permease subunit [Planctomycetota bacterium]